MIYQVNGNNFYVDQATYDTNNSSFKLGFLIVGTQTDAEAKLVELQKELLTREAVRFSICATFVNGNDTIWREVQESDPEDTICQVFDTMTGQYTQVTNKTEAYALNEQKKQQFLASVGLDKVQELSELPKPIIQPPFYDPNRYGVNTGNIPVEKL
jgi:hypothetical protein